MIAPSQPQAAPQMRQRTLTRATSQKSSLLILAVFLLGGCSNGSRVVATARGASLSVAQVRAASGQALPDPTARDAWLRSLLLDAILEQEAKRLGLQTAQEMKAKIQNEVRTTLTPNDVTDEDIHVLYDNNPSYAYAPRAAMTQLYVLRRQADAEDLAKHNRFERSANASWMAQLNAQLGQTQDGLPAADFTEMELTDAHSRFVPDSVRMAALATKAGERFGPITAKADALPIAMSYVGRVTYFAAESNSFNQVKDKLRTMAMDVAVTRVTNAAFADRLKDAHIDREALEAALRP